MHIERIVLEVFGGCNYSCQMCPQTFGRGKDFTRKMPLTLFESILDQIVPKYGYPVINLEGSGEPTMAKDLPLYIAACTKRGLPSYIYTNGAKFTGQLLRDCIDAGLSFVRFSCIGHDRNEYKKWMATDGFDLIKSNIRETVDYIAQTKAKCSVAMYHLLTDPNVDQTSTYKALALELGVLSYVWKMHNWSGNYDVNARVKTKRRTCGRPFAPELTVRAGGLDGKQGAVTPCCQTMGQPHEAQSVLGHFSDQTFEEIWNGREYSKLRKAHAEEDFDSISYCKGCDFLYEDPTVLVWTNDKTFNEHKMLGTQLDLTKYMNK